MNHVLHASVAASFLACAGAVAQSLYLSNPTRDAPALLPGEEDADPATPLYGVSLMAIRPPRPRTYQVHELVTIIINEASKQSSDQTLDTTKDASIDMNLGTIIDPVMLLEGVLEPADTTDLTLIKADAKRDFKGEGEYERNDRFTDRLTAEVIDVKPNGVLVLEAKRVIQMDNEVKTVVLSGNCRSDDVTAQGTVQSSQLANLALVVKHEGDVREAAKKGWLTRAIDTAFGF